MQNKIGLFSNHCQSDTEIEDNTTSTHSIDKNEFLTKQTFASPHHTVME